MRARDAAAPAAALLCLALTAPAAADARPAWTAGPAAGRPYVYLEGGVGSVLQDTVSVTNSGTRPVTVQLTAADATRTGTAAVLAPAARAVTVPARTRADIPFAVTVPADAVPGERTGAVVVTDGSHEARVRIHLRVNGPRLAALTVERVRVDDSGTIHYVLVNRGNTALTPRLSVRADGVLGTALDRPARDLPVTLRPGERRALTEPWPDRPALDAVTVRLGVTAADGAHAAARAEARFASAGAVGTLAAALLASVATAGYALLRRRRKATEQPAEPSAEPPSEEHLLATSAAGAER
ncbi:MULTISPECIES: hypothetical protein [Streptomyces]|uniref:DUF916 domain-containing protein n=1 Tax=Streptomyces solicathayae TaxID=3081768 RepID=A0ABZ0LWW6_9ACTN|nr:hypothetical protein [Streptomyces sp. HUAS YS2]WOX24010.1 hypothetical protein R2D22_22515 [Streptomyces sp. HUAS YS2]